MIKTKPATNQDRFLAKMHDYLTDSKTKLLREMTAQLQTGRNASRDDGMDSGDLAFEENTRGVSIMLSERERLRIGRIDNAMYDRMSAEWRREQDRCSREISLHQTAERSYMGEGVALLTLAKDAQRLFEKRPPADQRRLLNFVLSNSTWKNCQLSVTFRQPF